MAVPEKGPDIRRPAEAHRCASTRPGRTEPNAEPTRKPRGSVPRIAPGDSACRPERQVCTVEDSSSPRGLVHGWLVRHGIGVLRVTMGLVFLAFGAPEFFPGAGPEEDLAVATTRMSTFGIVPDPAAPSLVAVLEPPVSDDHADAPSPEEHRELVDALPARLLPLIAAGVMTPAEARAHIRRARQVLAARTGGDPGTGLALPAEDPDPVGNEDPHRGGSEGRHGP